MEDININDFDDYLEEGDFPASQKDIIKSAKNRGAKGEILDLLREIPDKKYASYSELKLLLNDFILKQREIGPT